MPIKERSGLKVKVKRGAAFALPSQQKELLKIKIDEFG